MKLKKKSNLKNYLLSSRLFFVKTIILGKLYIDRMIIKSTLKLVGRNFRFGPNSIFEDTKLISIGENVFMSERTIISTTVPLFFGDNVMFGPAVLMKDLKDGGRNESIILENDVWVGARTTILKGVLLREVSVIGACSVVTKPVLPYLINVGNPSRFIKCRFTKQEMKYHLSKINSKYTYDQIIK